MQIELAIEDLEETAKAVAAATGLPAPEGDYAAVIVHGLGNWIEDTVFNYRVSTIRQQKLQEVEDAVLAEGESPAERRRREEVEAVGEES